MLSCHPCCTISRQQQHPLQADNTVGQGHGAIHPSRLLPACVPQHVWAGLPCTAAQPADRPTRCTVPAGYVAVGEGEDGCTEVEFLFTHAMPDLMIQLGVGSFGVANALQPAWEEILQVGGRQAGQLGRWWFTGSSSRGWHPGRVCQRLFSGVAREVCA